MGLTEARQIGVKDCISADPCSGVLPSQVDYRDPHFGGAGDLAVLLAVSWCVSRWGMQGHCTLT